MSTERKKGGFSAGGATAQGKNGNDGYGHRFVVAYNALNETSKEVSRYQPWGKLYRWISANVMVVR
jgi:hypothetical protein